MIYRAGIIGCGWIACEAPDNHLTAYFLNENINTYILCDTKFKAGSKRKFKVDWFKLTFGPLYNDYMEMVTGNSLDIVSVCTPVETHCKIVCDIAPYVKAIYCEKPMATTLEECSKMIEVCAENETILQINHQRDFTRPRMRFSRDIIDTGTHAFALLDKTFGMIKSITKNTVTFNDGREIDIEYIPSEGHIFELDCTHNKERMIPKGVENLVMQLDKGWVDGNEVDAYTAFGWALKYKELINAK